MSYQNIGTPIFYVDHLLWLKSLGELEYQAEPGWSGVSGSDMVSLNPSNYHKMFNKDVTPSGNYSYIEYPQAPKIGESIKNYVAVLGHNCHTAGASIHFVNLDGGQTDAYPLVNGSYGIPEYDGFSMYTNIDFGGHKFIRIHGLYQEAQADNHIGCYSHGNYYQMPHSPDLSLTLTRDYSGIKTIETKGGVSLSNRFYHKPPNWGTLGAWELRGGYMSDDPQYEDSFRSKLSRSGRRIWDLSFSYLDSLDVMENVGALYWAEFNAPSGVALSTGDDNFDRTLLHHDSFYNQVVHKTNGFQLPFIFLPDSSNTNPDQFAICKVDQNSFQMKQVANGVYNVKLKIREIW